MEQASSNAEVNIHLRARALDRMVIDQAAELVGANRSQFMLASALKEAKNVLLDQSLIHTDMKAFHQVMDWLDREPQAHERDGMTRILNAPKPW
jgi:uncharacterized protein (DUF1778 family)